ncbi:MAG: phage tail spike protein [Saccharofermentanales bacterium]
MVLINIYQKGETDFSHNGITTLLPTSAFVTEGINGAFELKLSHPFDKSGKHEHLEQGNIIKASTPRGLQLFRIYRSVKSLLGEREVNARHISYDLASNFLENCYVDTKTGDAAIKHILSSTQYASVFSGSSDIALLNSARYINTNPLAALLGGEENSFINRWGGEVLRDNFEISVNTRIGSDSGEVIRYGKNLTDLKLDEDMSGVATRLLPTGVSENGAVLQLPEKYISSSRLGLYPYPIIKHIHYSDIKVGAEVDGVIKYQTAEAAYIELRNRVNLLFAAGIDLLRVSLAVEFVDRDTRLFQLGQLQLGDDVRVIHEQFGADFCLRIVAYDWNCLLERYENLTIGDRRPGLADSINQVETTVGGIESTLDGNITAINIAANAITAEKIVAGAIESDKIAARAITTEKLAVGAVVAENIAVGTITAETGIIGNGAIGTTQIADGSITDAKIVGLTASKITAGTLDAGEINVINLNAANITVGTINGQQIADGAITADKLAVGAVTSDKIPFGAIKESQLNWSTHIIF